MKTALQFVQKYFPEVDEVVDSARSIRLQILQKDVTGGRKKDPLDCAIARACMRQDLADGVIIGIGYSYLIKHKKATRFKTSDTLAREITSFDRSKKFEPGEDYTLSKVAPCNRLGARRPGPSGPRGSSQRPHKVIHHKTSNIRVLK